MTDLDHYLTDEMIEQGRKALTFGIMGCGQCCGENPPDELDHLDFDVARAHVAARAALEAVLPDIIQQAKAEGEPLPVVNHKGPCDTDASMFRTMAEKLRRNQPVGGSNARDALARLIEREIYRADRIEQGGQP